MDQIQKLINKAKKRCEKEIKKLRIDKFKTWTPLSKCVYKSGDAVYLRHVHVAGKLLNYKIIDDELTAILYMDKNYDVKHEVISTHAFNIYHNFENKSSFFDIEYDVYGPDFEHECAYRVLHHPKGSEPFWYKNQEFRELIEIVFGGKPKEKAEALAVAEAHEKATAHLD